MLKHIALTLALALPLSALADGAALFTTSSAPPTASEKSLLNQVRAEKGVKSTAIVRPDPEALNSKVITVSVDGKQMRFVGTPQKLPQGLYWFGESKSPPGSLMVTTGPDGFFSAQIQMNGKRYVVNRHVLSEQPL